MKKDNLIYDLGMHLGLDAQYYLSKGFDVVALEALPSLCERAKVTNVAEYENGRLTIVQKALFDRSGEVVSFFFNPDHDDWGSLDQASCEKGTGTSEQITVTTVSLQDLFAEFGVPHFLKCDLEGGDAILARNLVKCDEIPAFLSIEATSIDDLAMLRAAGYNRFQIVNQWMHPFTRAPNPSREGQSVEVSFNHHMSGLFGLDLPAAKWVNFEQMANIFRCWYECHKFDNMIGVGWLDVHATFDSNL